MLVAAPLAQAQTPEDRAYVAAREQAVAALEARYKSLPPPVDEAAWTREERAAEGELKAGCRAFWRASRCRRAFPSSASIPIPCAAARPPALSIASFSRTAASGRWSTTEGILQLWLGGRDPKAALEGDDVGYLRALNADAPVRIFAPLPVARPPGPISRSGGS